MRSRLNGLVVETRVEDIAAATAEAIVNPANTALVMGGGVAGALAVAAGPTVQEAALKLAPIALGEAVSTPAGNLRSRVVVHAATMPMLGRATSQVVALATRHALLAAGNDRCKSIAFPAMGAGFGGVSIVDSAKVMFEELVRHAGARQIPTEVMIYLRQDALLAFDDRFVWWLKRLACTCGGAIHERKHTYNCPAERVAGPSFPVA
jgi:O-acetyl-ADP-ribose deacetylase (regulator of RNase III)